MNSLRLFLKTFGIGLLLLSLVLVIGITFARADAPGAPGSSWYVCKYVGPPGNTETLQTGQNPIFVNEHAIETYPNVAVGDDFTDAQGHSVVVAGPYAPPGLEQEPVCPTTTPSPTVTPPPPPTCEETETCITPTPSPSPSPTETPPPTTTPPPITTPPPTPSITPTPSPSPVPSPSPSTTVEPCQGNGSERAKCQPVPVVHGPSSSTPLAFTGSSTVRLTLASILLLMMGLALMRIARRFE